MTTLEHGKVYVGSINREPVWYLGRWNYEESATALHQFEYIKHHEKVAGYGQTDEQVAAENYILDEVSNILYERDID